MLKEITSLKDDKIQLARSLNSLAGRKKSGKFLIEGIEALDWAIDAGVKIEFIFFAKQNNAPDPKYISYDGYVLSDGLMKKVSDTNYLIPIVAVGALSSIPLKSDFVVVLDNLQDFGNIGTIIRTCHAFGINTVFNTRKDQDLLQRKTIDSSRGRVFSTSMKTFTSANETISYLRNNNFKIITTSPYGNNLQSMISLSDQPVALIVGNETDGVTNEFIENADFTVQIPMYSEVESLNVGVATGISIYELKLKQLLRMIEKKIKSTLGREVNVTATLIQEVLDKELKKVSELTSKQLIFMMVLKCDRTMTISDMQKQFGIPDVEVNPFLEILLAKGFISKDPQGSLVINNQGVETIGKLWTIIENAEKKIMEDFSETEKTEFKRLIGKMQKKCAEIIRA
jgi:RNA methyltransferase, TrmH family